MAKQVVSNNLAALYRTHPCMIITTQHEDGTPNAATIGAYTIVGPELVGAAVAKSSHTAANIKRTGEYVINVPNVDHVQALENCARRVPPEKSELDEAGLTADDAQEVSPPIIGECVANIECRLWKEIEITTHTFFIGETVCGHIEELCQHEDGGLDAVQAQTLKDIRYPEPLYATLGNVVEAQK